MLWSPGPGASWILMMDEFTAELRARALLKTFPALAFPVPLDVYLQHVNAKVSEDGAMGLGEDGCMMSHKGRHEITVNARHSEKRKRFTICHEIGHIVLDLLSDHGGSAGTYERRPLNEVCCDVFAAELLLPVQLFKPVLDDMILSVETLTLLSDAFDASYFATGSRAVALSREPAAFVISHGGVIKYAFRSVPLRQSNVWVSCGGRLPEGSQSRAVRDDCAAQGRLEHDADMWFEAESGATVYEEAVHDASRDLTMTLLVCEADEPPVRIEHEAIHRDEDDVLLAPLDGVLKFRGKK